MESKPEFLISKNKKKEKRKKKLSKTTIKIKRKSELGFIEKLRNWHNPETINGEIQRKVYGEIDGNSEKNICQKSNERDFLSLVLFLSQE